MHPRELLNCVVGDVWPKSWKDYLDCQVNSERSMQASMYYHLRQAGIHSIIEPKMGDMYPDMIVVEGDTILAVMELKFVPHHYPGYEKDQNTLSHFLAIAKGADEAAKRIPELVLDPATGKFDKKRAYNLTPETLFIAPYIGRCDSASLRRETWTQLRDETNFHLIIGPVHSKKLVSDILCDQEQCCG